MSDPSVPTNPPPASSDDQSIRFDLTMTLGPEQLEELAKAIPAEDMALQLVSALVNEPEIGRHFVAALGRTLQLPQHVGIRRKFRDLVLQDIPDQPA